MAKINLNPKFYSKDAINQAIIDYKEVCKISYENGIATLDSEEKNIPDEFANYVLGLMK